MCDACVEIAEGRDIDVLEIDAATHTGVDNVREVIIEGLSIAPVRNRYKVFLIDEVHMLSASSFNALLKSIEEPPPHVIFMMATTELHKIPDTVLSRVAGLRVPHDLGEDGGRAAALHRHRGADRRSRTTALLLLARAGEGSMRDSLSALRSGARVCRRPIAVEDVVTVLGLVGRDLVLDMLDAVARRGRAGGVRAGRARHRARLRPAPAVPRAGARDPRPADSVGRSGARRRPRCRRRKASANG